MKGRDYLTDMNKNISPSEQDDFVSVTRKIGKTTFVVKIHFNPDSKETLQKKCERMIADEARNICFSKEEGVA